MLCTPSGSNWNGRRRKRITEPSFSPSSPLNVKGCGNSYIPTPRELNPMHLELYRIHHFTSEF
jgi:hypothetical protein